MKKISLILLLVISTPFVFADELVNEEWKVYEKINDEWVEIDNAEIETHYIVYLYEGESSGSWLKWEKSFTNNNPETKEVSFGQTVIVDPTYQFEESEESQFGIIAVMILIVAVISIIEFSVKTRLNIVPKY